MLLKKYYFILTLFIGVMMACPPASRAAYSEAKCKEGAFYEKVTSDRYWTRSINRLGNGIVNAGLGWTQLFVEPVRSVKSEDEDFLTGFIEGIGSTATFMVGGGWDIATFWVGGDLGKDFALKDSVLCHMSTS